MPFTYQADRFPEKPGCYLMLDVRGQVLYVGKAVNLKSRLSSYFRRKPDRSKTARLVKLIHDIDLMIVTNENESLTLERELIKHYRPPFNRAMRRGPSVLPYIAVTVEAIPRLTAADIARFEESGPAAHDKFENPGSAQGMIGPFPNVPYRNIVLEHVITSFGLPTCAPLEDRICLRFYQGLCAGICENRVRADQHAAALNSAMELLKNYEALLEHMRTKMHAYAEELRFEQALTVKKQIETLIRMGEKQSVNRPVGKRETIVCFVNAHALIAQLEEGTLRRRFAFISLADEPEPAFSAANLLVNLWSDLQPIEIITNAGSLYPLVPEQLSARQPGIRLCEPKRGRKRDLLNICRLNLEYRLQQEMRSTRRTI